MKSSDCVEPVDDFICEKSRDGRRTEENLLKQVGAARPKPSGN